MNYGKRYRLTIQVDDAGGAIEIDYPLTVEYDVQRTIFASANTGRFTVYNLDASARNQIFHDRYDVNIYRGIVFRAGYADMDPLPIIFQGNVLFAYSQRHRADWKTEIMAIDGGLGITSSQSERTFPAGTTIKDVLGNLLGDLLHVSKGAVGDFPLANDRGPVYAGNTWSMVTDVAENNGGYAFIDNEKAHVLKPNEYVANLPNAAPLITGNTGLLRAQMQFKNRVDAEVLFAPQRSIGQLVTLQSEEPKNNGDYIVKGISHRGIISGSHDATSPTLLNLDRGSAIPLGVLQ